MERYRATARILLFTFGLQCTVFAQAGPVPRQFSGARAVPASVRLTGPRLQNAPLPSPSGPAALSSDGRSLLGPLALKAPSPTLGLPATPADLTGCEDALLNARAPLLSVSRSTLWPPNHTLVDIGLGFDVTAACHLLVTGRIAVWADEPDESQTGDGDLPGDAQLAASSLFLRSERKGNADGRVYLLIGTATTGTGITGTDCATVVVPHGQNPASLNSVRGQAREAEAYCAAHSAAPPAFFKLTEGDLIRPNQPPQVNAGPDQAIAFPGTAVLDGTVSDDGLPSGVLNPAWSKLEGPGTVIFSPANAEDTTATFSLPGVYVLRLDASDTHLSASDTIRVEVNAANLAPVVDAGPDQILTVPTNTATLAGSVSDDGLPVGHLNTSWSVVDCPVGVTFGDPTQPVTTAAFAGPAQCTLRLSANDGQLASEDTTIVTVNPEPPPTLTVADASESEGNEGATGALLSLALSKPWPRAVSVDYMTFDGTANAGCDYRLRYGKATIEPGQTGATVLVPIVGELIPEGDETVVVRFGNPVEARLERTQAVLTLRNDDTTNQQPSAPFSRAPGDGATGVAAPPLLSWSATDPDLSDTLTHDVYLGTSFATAGQSWARTCPVTAGPGPRQGAVSGYDEAGDRLILFGGTDADPDTVWVLANATGAGGTPEWTAYLAPGGPGGIARAASAYDSATNRLLVHGGCTGDCAAASDETWVLTNANGLGGAPQWTRLAIAGPGARWDHAAAYDATSGRLIVFGGAIASGAEADDVWVLEDVGGAQPAWEALAPAGVAPSSRSGAGAVYDPTANRLIVFGGVNADGAQNDVWILTGANGLGGAPEWRRLEVAGDLPGRRFGAVAAYEPVSRRLIVFGGSTEGVDSGANFVFADTWMLTEPDGVSPGAQWIRLSPGGGPPVARFLPAFAYSAGANRLIVAGGANNKLAAPPEDHWVLADAAGSLPLVSPNQVETSYTATEAVSGPAHYWRIVTRDSHGAWRGSPVWRFTSNQPPQVDAGPDQTITLPTTTVNLTGTGSDDGLPPGSALTLAWSASGPGPVVFGDPASSVTIASFTVPGTYAFRLTATDSQLTGSDELVISVLGVAPVNQPPMVNAGPDQTITLPTSTVTLSGAATDDGLPMGGGLTASWTQVSGPATVTFTDRTQSQTTVTLGGAGTYVLRLTVGDGELAASDEVVITVSSPVCVPRPPGLVGWWPADGDAGELVAGWAGTPAGGLIFEPGMTGQAFRFDGSDDSVAVAASPALASDSFTIETWVNPDDLGARPLVEFGSPSQYGVHLWQGVAPQAQGPAPGTVFANLVSAPATWHYFGTGTYALTPSQWNHVALTYDSVTGRGAIYVNGALAAEQTLGSFTPSMLLPLNFGYRPNGGQRFHPPRRGCWQVQRHRARPGGERGSRRRYLDPLHGGVR